MLKPDEYKERSKGGAYMHNGVPDEFASDPGDKYLKNGNPNKPITHHKGYMQNGVPTTPPVLPGNMHGKG